MNDDTIEYQTIFVCSVLYSAGAMLSVKVRSQDRREGRFPLINLIPRKASIEARTEAEVSLAHEVSAGCGAVCL